MELAIATNIPASEWREESDRDIATALDILEETRKAVERRGRRR